jgi:PadR family transcriptional regulator, regulatory protein PadR
MSASICWQPREGCVLEIIGNEETYGYAITRRLNELGFAGVIEGTVYTILLRLEKNELVQVTKRPSGIGPPRKFYGLNDAGREELATFWAKWEYLSSRIGKLKEGVAAGKGVLELIGNDVAAFCDDLVKDSRTYADTYQESVSGEPGTAEK